MGGVVAFEMARLLEAAGETVDLLAVIDSRAPGGASPALDPDDPALLDGFVQHLGLAPDGIHLPTESAALTADERLRRAWETACAAELVPPGLQIDRFERLWAVFRANVAASASYRPESTGCDVLLLLAADRAGSHKAEAARWQALTRGTVRTATVPGDHFGVVREPHVRALADALARAMGDDRPPDRSRIAIQALFVDKVAVTAGPE